jgi:hypothetical protein
MRRPFATASVPFINQQYILQQRSRRLLIGGMNNGNPVQSNEKAESGRVFMRLKNLSQLGLITVVALPLGSGYGQSFVAQTSSSAAPAPNNNFGPPAANPLPTLPGWSNY